MSINNKLCCFALIAVSAATAVYAAPYDIHHLSPVTIFNSSSTIEVLVGGDSPYAPIPCEVKPGGTCKFPGLTSDDGLNFVMAQSRSNQSGTLQMRVTPLPAGAYDHPEKLHLSLFGKASHISISPETFEVICKDGNCPLTIRVGQDDKSRFYAGISNQLLATAELD
ncbi:MAG: hypothetical protein CMF39_03680 [Legionellaceae bacterium]|nr:hypothetical protein [Legionellaceae bacterium]